MLQEIAHNVWTATSAFKVFGLIALNGRMVIIKLKNGGLWVHSPIALTEELKRDVERLGRVEHLVAPSLFHHMFVGAWKEAFPEALVYAPSGLERKQPQLKVDHLLSYRGELASLSWSDEVEHVCLEGMPAVREHLFYHRASQTVIVTDFCFYFEEASGFTKLYLKLNRVFDQLNTPLLFKSVIKDREAFISSLRSLTSWEVDHLTLCHHAVLSEGAHAQWSELLARWLEPSR